MKRFVWFTFIAHLNCSGPEPDPMVIDLDLGAAIVDMPADGVGAPADSGAGGDDELLDQGLPVSWSVWNTYYYLASEADYAGVDDTTLFGPDCEPIAEVPAAYSDAVCIEGSGILEDGTVINYASRCDCGRPCPTGGIVCWKALDPATHPFGEGAFGNALVPMRSLAVDRAEIPLRTSIYLPKFDGIEVPSLGGVEGFVHDGCFRADDVGGAIDGEHVDIFAGPEVMWRHFEGVFPTRTEFDAYLNADTCMR